VWTAGLAAGRTNYQCCVRDGGSNEGPCLAMMSPMPVLRDPMLDAPILAPDGVATSLRAQLGKVTVVVFLRHFG